MTGERAWDMLATRYSVESAETGQVLSISITSRKRKFGGWPRKSFQEAGSNFERRSRRQAEIEIFKT